MKTCIISYGDYDFDGRLREFVDVSLQMGEVHAFTRGSASHMKNHHVFQGSYLRFILFAVAGLKKLGKVDLLLLDNRKSIIPGLIGRKYVSPDLTVLDCRELYVSNDVEHLTGKIGCYIEGYGIRKADCIIAANDDRADYMWKSRRLAERPIVYENYRMLDGGTPEEQSEAETSLQHLFGKDEIRIVSTGGCDPARLTLEMVEAMSRVSQPSRLYLVGPYSQKEVDAVKELMETSGSSNVEIIGRLNQAKLKYLLKHSHIGLVGYHQKDLNNKYCASGKIYEYLFEGLPVVTSTNPPLKRLCNEGVGVSVEDYAEGIERVVAEYPAFRDNVQQYASRHSIKDNNSALAGELQLKLKAKQAGRREVSFS